MAAKEPVAAQPFTAEEQRPLPPWPEARRRLAEADTYWLATVRPDGRPHVVPHAALQRRRRHPQGEAPRPQPALCHHDRRSRAGPGG